MRKKEYKDIPRMKGESGDKQEKRKRLTAQSRGETSGDEGGEAPETGSLYLLVQGRVLPSSAGAIFNYSMQPD
jgi:hypothetical protein